MEQILEYAYLRSLNLNQENVCQLLKAADYLGILEIVDLCCDFLKANLLPENCIGIMYFARQHSCATLEMVARKYILKNFVQVGQTLNLCKFK